MWQASRKALTWVFVRLLLFLLSPYTASYANAQTGYAFPGAIRSIEEGVPANFPDSVESRNWLVGLSNTLYKFCPDPKPGPAVVAARTLVLAQTFKYAATYLGSPDGVADGERYWSVHRECSRVIPVMEHAALVEYGQMLHEPDPDDFRIFLQEMASEQTRNRYPASIRTGIWWIALTQGTWVNAEKDTRLEFKSDSGEGKLASISLNRNSATENFSGGGIRATVMNNDHYAVVFHECAAKIRETRTEWCEDREKDHFITATQLDDGTLNATLHRWVAFRKQYVETVYHLNREQAELYPLLHAYPSVFRPHMFDLDMSHLSAVQQAQAKAELNAIGNKQQMTINCVYGPKEVVFWLDTVPTNLDSLLSVFPYYVITGIGHIAVKECPANYALAQKLHTK